MTTRVFLFDIDMTLVDTAGAGRVAFDRTFFELLGIPGAFDGYHFFGRVDLGIVREVYARVVGQAPTPEMEQRITAGYLARLEEELGRCPRYRVLPGVTALLEHLAARPDTALGLATGNFEPGARLKLAPGDLNRFFSSGGFGSDSDDRAELTRIGIQRALAGRPRPPQARVWVVGDTPLDVLAAHGAGASAIAVATGHHRMDELAEYGPELLLPDLSHAESWLPRVLGSAD